MFDKLKWFPDRLVINNLVFRLEHTKSENWGSEEHIMFFKVEGLVAQYQQFFNSYPGFHPKHMMELGMWDGGSAIFWNEVLKPEKIVGIDLKDREDGRYFRDYIDARELKRKIVTYWRTNQADKAKLHKIIDSEFGKSIDFVIDDCSHLPGPTKASFEAIFPFVVPGGWYIIEDWAWGHWKGYISRKHPWFAEKPLTDFVTELIKASGSFPEGISTIIILPGFVAVQRGYHKFDQPETFALKNHILENYFKQAFLRYIYKFIIIFPQRVINKLFRMASSYLKN
jgi:cephalosporin hydroxylase